jgi:thioredoxin 1
MARWWMTDGKAEEQAKVLDALSTAAKAHPENEVLAMAAQMSAGSAANAETAGRAKAVLKEMMGNRKPMSLEGKPLVLKGKTVDGKDFSSDSLKGKVVLVDFWATWCGPCRMIAPILDQLAKDYDGQVKVTKLDVDANIKTATKFNVRSIPMLLFFKDGKVVDQIVGAVPRQTIEAKFKQHVA